MTLRVSGKNLDIGQSLRSYIGARLENILSRHLCEPASGHVIVEREGTGFRTDCILHVRSGTVLQVEGDAQEAYASFNKAADRVEKRLQRLKERQRDRGNGVSLTFALGGENLRPESIVIRDAGEAIPVVIAERFASLKEMSVSDAVRELDVSKAPVVIFRHAGDGHTNIVYRRPDGNIGWIDTTTPGRTFSPLAAKPDQQPEESAHASLSRL